MAGLSPPMTVDHLSTDLQPLCALPFSSLLPEGPHGDPLALRLGSRDGAWCAHSWPAEELAGAAQRPLGAGRLAWLSWD